MTGVLLVTGGSRGIGAACARLAAARGYRVCFSYRSNEAKAETLVAEIEAAGGTALAVRCDVGEEAEILQLFAAVDGLPGPLVALINNAGIAGELGRLEACTADDIARVMNVNVVGAFLCAREAVKRMSAGLGGRGGTIVNITSAAAKLGGANQYLHYAASKAALECMTHGLGLEVAGDGIRVVAVRPGLIDTEFHADMGMPGRVAELAPSVPLGRAGQPGDIAEAALWACSEQASYVTATTIEVTGGR